MAVRVGIDGFGRIGRQVLKAIRDFYPKTMDVVAFNDVGDLKTMTHLLKYDSNYGRFNGTVEVGNNELLCSRCVSPVGSGLFLNQGDDGVCGLGIVYGLSSACRR